MYAYYAYKLIYALVHNCVPIKGVRIHGNNDHAVCMSVCLSLITLDEVLLDVWRGVDLDSVGKGGGKEAGVQGHPGRPPLNLFYLEIDDDVKN